MKLLDMEVGVDPFMVVNLEHCITADGRHTKNCENCIYTTHSITHGGNGQDGSVLQIAAPVQCLGDVSQSLPRIQQQHLIQYPQLCYDGTLQSPQLEDQLSTGQMLTDLYQGPYPYVTSQTLQNSFLAPLTVHPQPVQIVQSSQPSEQELATTAELEVEESAYPLDDFEYYKEIEKYLTFKEYPANVSENYKKNLCKRAQYYIIINGVLHHGRKQHKEVIMKKEEQKEMLKKIHVTAETGIHLGVKKMFAIIQKEYFWRGMYVDVVNYVKQCTKCSDLFDVASQLKAKERRVDDEETTVDDPSEVSVLKNMGTQMTSRVWQKVEIQVNGPYKVTNSRNEYIISITDPESRFICACALPKNGLSTRISEFIVRTFCLFGFPVAYIVCEQDLFEAILSEYGWRIDGLIEHVLLQRIDSPKCSWVDQLLELLVSTKPATWDKEMDRFLFQFKVGTMKQFVETLPLSPFSSMYGREPVSHCDAENKENMDRSDTKTRRNGQRTARQCTHCEKVFASKISLLIHQQKHMKQLKHKICHSLVRKRQARDYNQEDKNLVGQALQEVDFKPPETWVESTVSAVKSYLAETKEMRRKRGKYQKFTAEIQEQMAEYAIKYGYQKAAEYFSQSLETHVSDSTIRNIAKSHISFEASLREEIGMFAVNFGVKNAICYFSKRLNRNIPQTLVQKFKSLYLNKYPDTILVEEEKVKSPCKSKKKTLTGPITVKRINKYSERTKEEVALYACNHSIAETVRYFKEKFGISINEKAVRKFYRAYLNKKEVAPDLDNKLIIDLQPVDLETDSTLVTIGPNTSVPYAPIVDSQLNSHLYPNGMCFQPQMAHIMSQEDDFTFSSTQNFGTQEIYNHISPAPNNQQDHPSTSVPTMTHVEGTQPCIITQDSVIITQNPPTLFEMNIESIQTGIKHGSVKTGTDNSSQELEVKSQNLSQDYNYVNATEITNEDSQKCDVPLGEVKKKKSQGKVALRNKKKIKKITSCKKRGSYTTYSPELRAEIGKYAAEHGSLKACSYFSQLLGHDIPESTARGLKEKYLLKVKHCNVTSLGYSPRGRPLRLGKYDEVVQECLREILRSGEKVSSFLAITTAKEILNKYDPGLLQENGGTIVLNTTWAKSFLKRIGVRNNS